MRSLMYGLMAEFDTPEQLMTAAESAYEAGFLSTAHDGDAIAKACDVLTEAIKTL